MVRKVAAALARLGQRERFTGEENLVFIGVTGGHLNSKDVRAEYKAALARAGLRNLRFHDLRHTFGTRAVEQAESILELKEWGTCQRADHDALLALQVKGWRSATAGSGL
jgi:integrase